MIKMYNTRIKYAHEIISKLNEEETKVKDVKENICNNSNNSHNIRALSNARSQLIRESRYIQDE